MIGSGKQLPGAVINIVTFGIGVAISIPITLMTTLGVLGNDGLSHNSAMIESKTRPTGQNNVQR